MTNTDDVSQLQEALAEALSEYPDVLAWLAEARLFTDAEEHLESARTRSAATLRFGERGW